MTFNSPNQDQLKIIASLLEESRDLEKFASKIQQGESITVSTEASDKFITDYHKWYAKCVSILPEDLKSPFRSQYEGSFLKPRIKKFLESFAEPSIFHPVDEKSKELFPYWTYTYKNSFYPYILAQRQLLIEASKQLSTPQSSGTIDMTELLEESKELEETASKIQQGEKVGLPTASIQAFIEKYHMWYGCCLSLLPDKFKENFRSQYEGTWYSLKIKKFLEAPTQHNPLYEKNNDKEEPKLLSYWLYPYNSTFRISLLTQRELLIEAREEEIAKESKNSLEYNQSIKVNILPFKNLILELLQALGFTNTETIKENYGFDLQSTYYSNSLTGVTIPQKFLINIKYRDNSNSSEPTSLIPYITYITSLLSSSQVSRVSKVIFIDYNNLTSFGREYREALIKEFGGRVEVWDREQLDILLARFPEIRKKYENIISEFPDNLANSQPADQLEIAKRLSECKPGKEHWANFEDICIDVLTKAFVPPLKEVKPQARTESGLERRDAVLPLLGAKDGWEQISQKYEAHFLLCEFKNYTEPIGKDEVNQTATYLKKI
jgi:hypothetical protein